MNFSVTPAASTPPEMDRTPAGTSRVTRWDGPKAWVGVNTIELPVTLHVPATAGVSCGLGELAAMGAEKVTTISAAPSTPVACLAGVIERTCSGPLGKWAA
ncbi:MAG TPA: hypothetical protein VLM11_19905 [Streptosporangiaceae bacterium]|nr:hypothetical protein [Streptosporangiaceae bacterium]